jgi:hypothetical protein
MSSEGVKIVMVLDDLVHIRLPTEDRDRVKILQIKHGQTTLSPSEQVWLRKLYNRHYPKIEELHKSYDAVRSTDA